MRTTSGSSGTCLTGRPIEYDSRATCYGPSKRISSRSTEDLTWDAVSHLPLLKALQSSDAEAAPEGLDTWYAATRAYVFRECETKQAKEA